jgi:hypothetical protein
LSFDEDILAFFVLAIVLATFFKLWAIFSQTSGHPNFGLNKLEYMESNFQACKMFANKAGAYLNGVP